MEPMAEAIYLRNRRKVGFSLAGQRFLGYSPLDFLLQHRRVMTIYQLPVFRKHMSRAFYGGGCDMKIFQKPNSGQLKYLLCEWLTWPRV